MPIQEKYEEILNTACTEADRSSLNQAAVSVLARLNAGRCTEEEADQLLTANYRAIRRHRVRLDEAWNRQYRERGVDPADLNDVVDPEWQSPFSAIESASTVEFAGRFASHAELSALIESKAAVGRSGRNQGVSFAEQAANCGINPRTWAHRLSRVRTRIRRALIREGIVVMFILAISADASAHVRTDTQKNLAANSEADPASVVIGAAVILAAVLEYGRRKSKSEVPTMNVNITVQSSSPISPNPGGPNSPPPP